MKSEAFGEFWRGKSVVVTGHTGFKGSWLCLALLRYGATVTGVALDPTASPNLFNQLGLGRHLADDFRLDVRDAEALQRCIKKASPDVIFHLAAQSLVLEGYRHPLETISTNVVGTSNILSAVLKPSFSGAVVVVTTDKVYENAEQGQAFVESDRLGGNDPYSASKAAAEIITTMFHKAFYAERSVGLATARAGNVIGGGDWSRDRLIPDLVRAWTDEETAKIRSPRSTRPWQHVLDPLWGYLSLGKSLFENPNLSGAFNFGPDPMDVLSVEEVVNIAARQWNGPSKWSPSDADNFHEATLLRIDSRKAKETLGVRPVWEPATAIERAITWYSNHRSGNSAEELCLDDIRAFETST